MTKPSIPQGTRDFSAEVVRKRTYILNTIRDTFELYGFEPLETPAMENLDTLTGKYGEEGDKLIFKILNNGLENPSKEKQVREGFERVLQGKNSKGITERALKYDLTIPFARYVAMNHGQLSFPFKRYQVQPVWRADRPQKGRYREFFQCDADVVGSHSLLCEVELIQIYHDVFARLGISYELKINHRKILSGIAGAIGAADRMMSMTTAIDKFERAGWNGVKEELAEDGFTDSQISALAGFLFPGDQKPVESATGQAGDSVIQFLERATQSYSPNSDYGKGVTELAEILKKSSILNAKSKITIDLTLARGLNYYTGMILEAKATDVEIGSIGGGGRYDDLTGLFGVPDIPGVGISFGVDRIYDVMEELGLFPPEVHTGTRALFFNLGEAESTTAMELATRLRKEAIPCEVYHEKAKFDKQFKYAEKRKIPFVIIIGEEEMRTGSCQVKNLVSGEQKEIPFGELPRYPFKQ